MNLDFYSSLNRYTSSIKVSLFRLTRIVLDVLYHAVNCQLRDIYLLMSSSSTRHIHTMQANMRKYTHHAVHHLVAVRKYKLTPNLLKLTLNVIVGIIGCNYSWRPQQPVTSDLCLTCWHIICPSGDMEHYTLGLQSDQPNGRFIHPGRNIFWWIPLIFL